MLARFGNSNSRIIHDVSLIIKAIAAPNFVLFALVFFPKLRHQSNAIRESVLLNEVPVCGTDKLSPSAHSLEARDQPPPIEIGASTAPAASLGHRTVGTDA